MTDGTDSDSTDDRTTKHTDGGRQVAGAGTSASTAAGGRTRVLDAIVLRLAAAFDAYAYRWVQASFAFVFFYFGLQKWPVIQGASPVRPPVRAFVEAVGFGGWIPLVPEVGLMVIGIYEVSLGVLWFGTIVEEIRFGTSQLFVFTALMTVAHQVITLLPLAVVSGVAFRSTQLWVPLVGTFPFPVALDWLSAFILKNLLFFGAFFYVFVEWAERYHPSTTGAPQ